MGYDKAYVQKYAEFALQSATDSFRIEVLNTMILIVKGVSNEKSTIS